MPTHPTSSTISHVAAEPDSEFPSFQVSGTDYSASESDATTMVPQQTSDFWSAAWQAEDSWYRPGTMAADSMIATDQGITIAVDETHQL